MEGLTWELFPNNPVSFFVSVPLRGDTFKHKLAESMLLILPSHQEK